MKQKILGLLLTLSLPMLVDAVEIEGCKSYTMDQVTTGNEVVVCIGSPSGESGDESHHRFVNNKYSSTYNSVLVVNTVVHMGGSTIPVYCVNESKHGVGDQALKSPASYAVTLKDWDSFVSVVGSEKATRIRNAILNGYPAKSAEELGFTANSLAENNYDAFVATKLGVFTLLDYYGYTSKYGVTTYYEPIAMNDDGSRGKKIVSKIEDVVKYSVDTPAMDQPVTFSEGNVTEDDNYLTKTVTVNPPMGGTLTVSLTNSVSGTKIDGMVTNSKEYTNSGYFGKPITVTISVPKSSITTEQALNLSINLNYRHLTYDLYYGVETSGVYQSYLVPKPRYINDKQTYNLTYSRTCDQIIEEYKACNKDNSCSNKLKEEYQACRTCDDVIKEHQACYDCEKVKKEYDVCSKDDSCSEELLEKYEACDGNFVCSDELNKEYQECVTCDDVIKDYQTCSTCENVKKEYDKCSQDNSCSQDLLTKYESCNGNFTCSDKLKEEYQACIPKRTCENVKEEYNNCVACEKIKAEYDTCSKDNSCSDELLKQYENCNYNFVCSDELIGEYNACFPTIEEENPNTSSLNLVLVLLAVIGSSLVGYNAYSKRKELKSQI